MKIERKDNAEAVIGIWWWRSFARDRAPAARCETDGRLKKDLDDARQKIEATVELCKLSTVSTPYAIPWRVCEPGTVAHLQFLATWWFTRSSHFRFTTRMVLPYPFLSASGGDNPLCC